MQTPVLINSCAAARARLLLAHGAGAPMDSEFMNDIAQLCCDQGLEVVRFEFPYMAQRRSDGRKRPPNKTERLLQSWQAMVDHYSGDALPLFIGGKSMGGRMATQWAATAQSLAACRAVVCLGYPFHPPGKPDTLRLSHLPELSLPLLIVQGTRDALGSQEQVQEYALGPMVRCHWLDTGNHDLVPLKRSGKTHRQALLETSQVVTQFVGEHL